MIKPFEIQQTARKERVRDTQIEKDYILSWVLTGIAHNELLSKVLIFKGGTVLKKFYINYVGPLGGAGANKQVKVDISKNELLQFGVEEREMFEK
jgi:hypothetical protein